MKQLEIIIFFSSFWGYFKLFPIIVLIWSRKFGNSKTDFLTSYFEKLKCFSL